MIDTVGRYKRLALEREPFLHTARNAAALTIPSLMPPEGHAKGAKLRAPYQSLGARGVNHLSSSLLLSLLPPSQPFFRLKVSDIARQNAEQALEQGLEGAPTAEELEADMVATEKAIMQEFETSSVRTAAHEALKHQVVSGNALIYWPEGDKNLPRIYALDEYVVDRDHNDNLLEIIVRELVDPDTLSDEIRTLVASQPDLDPPASPSDRKHLELYTVIKREPGDKAIFKQHQEIKGVELPGSQGTWPEEVMPWRANRFFRISGESYGRGFIEENFGDLASLNVLQRSLLEAAEQAAKVIWLVKPNSTTKQRVVTDTPNGQARPGNIDDVAALRLDKSADMRFALDLRNELFQSLSAAFLLRQGVQRNAERVTAEEVRLVAQELEDSLGGVYSVQATEFQLPLVKIAMARLERRGVIEALPDGIVEPSIVTGLEALGRGHEIFSLKGFLGDVIQLPGAEMQLNVRDIIASFANGYGISINDALKSEADVQAEQQQQQLMQLAEKAAAPVAGNLTAGAGVPTEQG